MLKKRKLWITAFLALGFGYGMYWAGKHNVFSDAGSQGESSESTTIVKRHAVKPKSMPLAIEVKTKAAPRFEYTFFETLDDPKLASYVDLSGRVVQKVSIQPTSIKQEEASQAPVKESAPVVKVQPSSVKESPPPVVQVNTETEKKVVAKKPNRNPTQSPRPEIKEAKPVDSPVKFAEAIKSGFKIQVGSFRKVERADELKQQLLKKGLPVFIASAEIPEKGTWHRVFLGPYKERGSAEKATRMLEEQNKLRPVILAQN